MAAFCSALLAVSMREAGFEQCLQQQAKKDLPSPAGAACQAQGQAACWGCLVSYGPLAQFKQPETPAVRYGTTRKEKRRE